MLYISFTGWWQMRMALDPDPNDEPRGASGPTVAVPGEPNFDGIIRLRNPVSPRWPHDKDIGVAVSQVAVDDPSALNGKRVIANHPLDGAEVDFVDDPTFAERGFVILYQKMPVDPFHLVITGNGIRLEVLDLWDPSRPELTIDDVAANDPELLPRRCVAVQPQSPLVASTTGIIDYPAYRLARKEALIARLKTIKGEPERSAIEMRIDMLAKDDMVKNNAGMVGLQIEAQQFLGLCGFYSFPIQGTPLFKDAQNRMGGQVGTSQAWFVEWWMGGFDVDTLTGYLSGTLTVPFFAGKPPPG
jgi:hypothetical protein